MVPFIIHIYIYSLTVCLCVVIASCCAETIKESKKKTTVKEKEKKQVKERKASIAHFIDVNKSSVGLYAIAVNVRPTKIYEIFEANRRI